MTREKRTEITGMTTHTTHGPEGVGGRHSDTGLPPLGGGYLDIYTETNKPVKGEKKATDPRLNELRDMGLSPQWRHVAETIGFDAFLFVWTELKQMTIDSDSGRLYIPSISEYYRYQRNKYIVALYDSGLSTSQIKIRLEADLNVKCERGNIWRVISKRKKKPTLP